MSLGWTIKDLGSSASSLTWKMLALGQDSELWDSILSCEVRTSLPTDMAIVKSNCVECSNMKCQANTRYCPWAIFLKRLLFAKKHELEQ